MHHPGSIPVVDAVLAEGSTTGGLISEYEAVEALPKVVMDLTSNGAHSAESFVVACNLKPAAPPPPEGDLFRCAVCQELVYESQLDHHLTVCPEEQGDHSPEKSELHTERDNTPQKAAVTPNGVRSSGRATGARSMSPPTTGGSGNDVGRRLPQRKHMEMPTAASPSLESENSEPLPEPLRRSESLPPRTENREDQRSKALKNWDDSHFIKNMTHASQRTQQKLDKLRADLETQMTQACTFQPKVNSSWRQSPRSREVHCARRQASAGRRKEALHAELNEQMTWRPQINKLSHEIVQQSRDENLRPVSVFERLHALASKPTESQSRKSEPDSGPVTPRSEGPTSRRRTPTTELLYSDALDRRERLRALEEQTQEKN